MKIALLLLLGQTVFSAEIKAEEVEARDSVNPRLTAKAEALIKSAMKVIKEDEGVVYMYSPGHSFATKTQMLFFRRRGTRIEMIATGVFTSENIDAKTGKKSIVADLDRDNIIKYPQLGDYAVPMNDPNIAALDGKDGNEFPAPDDTEEGKNNPLPGYIEFGLGLFSGNFNTTTSTEANQSKISSGYRFSTMHFAYYSDFIPIGVEYDSYSGNFPTKTYKSTVITSGESVSGFSFNYRFKPILSNHLAFTAKVATLSNTFTTSNTDVSLLTTKTSGLGFGLRAQYQIVSPVWKKEPKDFFIQLQSLYSDFLYYPTITAADSNGVSRGDASTGSTMMQYRVGAIGLAWIQFIPIFKRWVIQASYGASAYNLKFTGPTVSEVGNPKTLVSGGTGTETEKDYRFFIGIRLEDPIKFLFTNDEKKEK